MKLFSNEIVFRGHPDKVCDQISDAILDQCLCQDKGSRCGVEVVGGKSAIFITGEITTKAKLDIQAIARRVLRDVGYCDDRKIIVDIGAQSHDINLGTNSTTGGAGDNGMMFGYATSETEALLPKAMCILQDISGAYDSLRKLDHRFLPDGKAQLTGEYDKDFRLQRINTLTLCYQNTEEERDTTDGKLATIVNDILALYDIPKPDRLLINPTGRFAVGGFDGDAGLTGRKIVVDSYHGFAPVGGGAFSGKDPTKVDRSGAYKAREIAKSMLLAHDLKWCQVQLSYSIGIREPMAIYITSDRGDIETPAALYEECTPSRIIADLGLLYMQYEPLAAFGHFAN